MRKIAFLKVRARYLVAALSCTAMLAGCAQFKYYYQAAQGQYSLWSDSRSVDDWLGDPDTEPKLRARLEKAVVIRKFAVQELGLPDNASYKQYAALNRPFVLWNVVATPELSLRPIQWCFPIAGCVAYRGYYSKEDAQAYAEALRKEGDDVQVGGVPAYSTLGWFSDPLLSTFINYSDAELARMVFHELAHQVVYIAGDSRFNEAFASAVEEAGVDRWLALYGNEAMREAYVRYSMRRKEFLGLLVRHRQMLSELYASKASTKKKREEKARIFAALQTGYQELKAGWGGYAGYDRFFAEKLTNAHLAAVATYNDLVPAFKALLAQEKTFPRFYAAVQRMSNLPSVERNERLVQLARSVAPASPAMTAVAEQAAGTAGGH